MTAPAVSATVTTTPARPVPSPGTVQVTGALTHPFCTTLDQLRAMPQQTVRVEFQSDKGSQHHTEVGVPLAKLIPPTALATHARKEDLLSFVVLAVGADGYRAALSYGELSPDFGNKGVLLAITEDGVPLSSPRLIVPGDVKGGRYVTDLTELRVSRLGPA
ncbi:MAG: hypothetical protein ACRDSH_07820 [Pseudonocardiaceae bacterium]